MPKQKIEKGDEVLIRGKVIWIADNGLIGAKISRLAVSDHRRPGSHRRRHQGRTEAEARGFKVDQRSIGGTLAFNNEVPIDSKTLMRNGGGRPMSGAEGETWYPRIDP